MSLVERAAGALVANNNALIARVDPVRRNPRPLDQVGWHQALVAASSEIRAEWAAFITAGGQLPHIEDVLGEHQGNNGPWRVGVVVADGATTRLARRSFTRTTAALAAVPGLHAALWSVLDAGTELEEHQGPNAGVLRYHLGIDCPPGSTLTVGPARIPYVDGAGILFDDTAPHAAWNHGAAPRVTLFLEVARPLPTVAAWRNRSVQALIARDRRRRTIVVRADEWDAALNPEFP